MNENLKTTITVFGVFILCIAGLSIYLGLYESGILYDDDWQKNFKVFDLFKTDSDMPNPKHVTIEFLKKEFGG